MKKLLALVLALVMSMSLVTISNAAFKDADKISNKEAVDVMVAVGVLAGYDNGEFGATDTLTRAQACKIIAYLDLGKDVAEALPAVQVFSDLSANNWAAKYVAYCADAGYVSGVGDNKFAPDEKVTGYQFGKMLLCVLGYDQKVEEMTGSSWEIKVAKLMESNSLTKGTTKLGSAALTREEAAQYALNALKATCVEYDDKGTTIVGNGITITTGAKKAKAVTVTGETSANDYARKADAASIGTQQLVEKLYSKTALTLYKDNTATNGQAGYTWKVSKNGVISSAASFVNTETVIGSRYDNTSVAKMAQKDSTNSKYVAELASSVKFYVNGDEVTATAAAADTYWYDATAKTVKYGTPGTDINGYGVKIDFIDTNDDLSKAEKVYFTTYTVATVVKAPVVKTNTVDNKDYVYVSLTNGQTIGTAAVTDGVKAADVTGYAGLEKDDVVLVTKMDNGTYIITKLEGQTGKVSATASGSMTINGTATKIAAKADSTITSYSLGYAKDVTFFYDSYGYIVRAEAITETSNSYLYVIDNDSYDYTSFAANSNRSKVAFDDGTTATITVSKFKGVKWGDAAFDGPGEIPAEGNIYAYTKNDDGTYSLLATTTGTGKNANGAITAGVAAMKNDSDESIKADAGTKFILQDKNGSTYKNSYTAYTGIANVPTLNQDTNLTWKYVVGSDGFIDVVFVTKYAKVNATSDTKYLYVLGTTFTTVYDADGAADYYTFSAIVDGEKTDVKAAVNSMAATTGLGSVAAVTAKKLYTLTYTDGKIAANAMAAATAGDSFKLGTKIDDFKSGTVEIGDVAYTVADNCKVYVINAAADEVEVTELAAIEEGTYTGGVTAVTAACGKSSPTAAEKNTLVEIYIQK